jgi:hypothetical protein
MMCNEGTEVVEGNSIVLCAATVKEMMLRRRFEGVTAITWGSLTCQECLTRDT